MNRKKGSVAALVVVVLVALVQFLAGGGGDGGGNGSPAPPAPPAAEAPRVRDASPAAPRPDAALRFRVTERRRVHILDGDRTGGGHGPGRGTPGKSMFPDSMTDAQVVSEVERIANDPRCYDDRRLPSGRERTEAYGDVRRRDGGSFRVKVVVDPGDGSVVTAYPLQDQRGR